MPEGTPLKGKDWAILFLVLLQVGEIVAAATRFPLPWTLWAAVGAVGALLAMVSWTVQMMKWFRFPSVAIMFIGLGGALLTFLVRGAF